ncbi:MAG: glycosyltransferase [Actinomycetota bacterium]|nr:glycosyltransferase [Actinomycetota bacterium]
MTTAPIAVVVSTVDRPEALARCLGAILDGAVMPTEIIVIDQGGEPETADVVAANAKHGVPVRHVVVDERGLSKARNLGLRLVRTPWIAFTDDDCAPDPSWIGVFHRRTVDPDAPDGIGGRVLAGGDATPGTFALAQRLWTEPKTYRGPTLPWLVGSGANMLFRVDVLRRAGGYDERLGPGSPGVAGEDLEVLHRLLRDGATLAFEPAAVVFHDRVGTERRVATRSSYGFGMGAFVGMWLRRDRWVAYVLARWLRDRLVGVARAVKHRDRWRLHEERLTLTGATKGLRYGWRLRSPISTSDPAPAGGFAEAGVDVE